MFCPKCGVGDQNAESYFTEKEFIELPSITENTTELLRPAPRAAERERRQ
jgi:hypothetical protein